MDIYTKIKDNDSQFDFLQLEEINIGENNGLDVSVYSKPEYSSFLMRQLRKGLEVGIDLSPYVKYDVGIIYEIRKAILSGVDLVPYVEAGYDMEQLAAIRPALARHLNIKPYLNLLYHGSCIREIATGLEHGIDVLMYADVKYTWRKMREIRLGLENRVDVTQYMNDYYSHEQMREIRLGLEEGLDVSSYKSLMYTPKVMKKKRMLLEATTGIAPVSDNLIAIDYRHCTLYISDDEMCVFLEVKDENWKPTAAYIRKLLRNNGIIYGVDDVGIAEVVSSVNIVGKKIKVAGGKLPHNGKNGYYSWNFDTQFSSLPKENKDGTVDFNDVRWFERVSMGQTLATYYVSTAGEEGRTVMGKAIPVKRGRELPKLMGTGFRVLEDGRTYVAKMDGHVRLCEKQLKVEKLLILEAEEIVKSRLDFDGSICIHGDVEDEVSISAMGDIVVDGCVKKAVLNSGGSVMVCKGMNAVNGEGRIKAEGDIVGGYFESVELEAGENIYLTSSLNSELKAGGAIVSIGKKGGIVGGCACAEKGFCISNAGNSSGKNTILRCGLKKEINERYMCINNKVVSVEKEIGRLKAAYDEMCNKYTLTQRMSMDIYSKLESAIYTKNMELNKLKNKIEAIKQRIEKAARAQIIVDCNLYQNVSVEIGYKSFIPQQQTHVTIKKLNNHFSVESMDTRRRFYER